MCAIPIGTDLVRPCDSVVLCIFSSDPYSFLDGCGFLVDFETLEFGIFRSFRTLGLAFNLGCLGVDHFPSELPHSALRASEKTRLLALHERIRGVS